MYATDHSEFIEVAKTAAAHNDVTGIQFEQVHSRDFEPLERVDVILHEQMGDDLFNENILDLKRRVLAEGGTILPGKFELFLEPVTLREEYRAPFVHELTVEDIDFGSLEDHPRMEKYRPDGYARTFVDSAAVDGFLSTPAPMLSFDLNDLASEEALPTELSASRRVDAPGVMDGLCLYFRTEFDEEIQFDTSPLSTNTSWHNRVLRTPQREFDDGEEITYTVDADPLYNTGMWSVSVE